MPYEEELCLGLDSSDDGRSYFYTETAIRGGTVGEER